MNKHAMAGSAAEWRPGPSRAWAAIGGVVAGEAILGANVFKDLFAGIRDLVGGRSATFERELQRVRDIAIGTAVVVE